MNWSQHQVKLLEHIFAFSTPSSPGAEQRWMLLHTYFWVPGTSGEHICCRRQEQLGVCSTLEQGDPQRSQISVEKLRAESPALRGVHMPESQGTGAADVSHAPLGPPCPFPPPSQTPGTAGVTGIYSCTLSCSLWLGQPTFIDFFLQTQLGTSFCSSFPPGMFCQGADTVRIVWKVLLPPEPVEPLQFSEGLETLQCLSWALSPDTTHMLLYDYWWMLDCSEKL